MKTFADLSSFLFAYVFTVTVLFSAITIKEVNCETKSTTNSAPKEPMTTSEQIREHDRDRRKMFDRKIEEGKKRYEKEHSKV